MDIIKWVLFLNSILLNSEDIIYECDTKSALIKYLRPVLAISQSRNDIFTLNLLIVKLLVIKLPMFHRKFIFDIYIFKRVKR